MPEALARSVADYLIGWEHRAPLAGRNRPADGFDRQLSVTMKPFARR